MKYTLRDIASDKFKLANALDLANIEGVNSVTTSVIAGEKKKVIVNLGFFGFIFHGTTKTAIKNKVVKDLGTDFDFGFGI